MRRRVETYVRAAGSQIVPELSCLRGAEVSYSPPLTEALRLNDLSRTPSGRDLAMVAEANRR